jgi:hypothetical protein
MPEPKALPSGAPAAPEISAEEIEKTIARCESILKIPGRRVPEKPRHAAGKPTTSRGKSKVSEAQKEARRRNGKKSRGPRTERGKAVSSMNAVKHGVLARKFFPYGLFARESVLRNNLSGESKVEFQALLDALDEVFNPADTFERMLVEKMAGALWRQRRLRRHERVLTRPS